MILIHLLKRATRWLRNLIRDLRFLSGMVPALLQIKKIAARREHAHDAHLEPGRSWSIASWWEDDVVAKYPDRIALIYVYGDEHKQQQQQQQQHKQHKQYTYSEVDRISNQCARMAMDAGIEAGGSVVVALSHENSPEYIFWFLGLVKIGVPVALINTNVEGAGLAQCLQSCRAEWLIHSEEMAKQVETLSSIAIIDEYQKTGVNKILRISEMMNGTGVSSARMPPGLRKNIGYADTVLHIFTSGTTGLPKAAKISHLRYFGSSLIFSHLIGFNKSNNDDVLYCPLPLYHSSAIVLGLGLCFHNGMPFVFQRKFSVSNFWSTCIANNVTVVQYIGELCRYLTMAKSSEEERKHCVRLALGNGLDRNVWETFQQRSGIPKIVEFYAATEANVGLVNTTENIGAIGVLSALLSKKHPGKLLRFDFETGQPHRDENGLCIECKHDEVGEFVGMINPTDATQKFDGYSDEADTEKKLLRNVLRIGDEAFRSGDLMTRDRDGYMYFVDRIGDTIRWKGENVSTNEVEAVLRSCPGVKECSVYGIQVAGYEGKAGMALVKVESLLAKHLPMRAIEDAVARKLPEYARPVCLRFTEDDMETTVTFKYRKQLFASQGFESNEGSSEGQCVFVRLKTNKNEFVKLTKDIYTGILGGSVSL